MIYLLLLSILVSVIYIGGVVLLYGIPKSVSESYYLLPKNAAKPIFFGWAILSAIPLLIYWLSISPPNTQFLAFLSCAGLCFVGTASAFKENLTKTVHYVSALASAACGLTWIFLNTNFGIFMILLIVLFLAIGYRSKSTTDSSNTNALVFFLELIVYLSIYISVYTYK